MSETPDNTALAELLAAIADRKIRRKVQKLLQLGEEAVRALGELDSALYVREGGEAQIQIVSDAVLSHLRRLLDYLRHAAAEAPEPAEEPPPGEPGPSGNRPSLNTIQLGAALGIVAARNRSDAEKWRALVAEMDTLHFGLSSELREYDRRFADALKNDRQEQALTDLNDATDALMDGVFAAMTTVYEIFLGHAEPDRMIPGHRHTLGKALAVRLAVAELRRTVRELNAPIQKRETDREVAAASWRLIVELVDGFLASQEFTYLRSDTRKEFERVRETLAGGSPKLHRNEMEGFDKYLDSLAVISQRGVLIKHDNDIKAKVSADLERALTYADRMPLLVCDVIVEAFAKAERLLGLNDELDEILERWAKLDDEARADPGQVVLLAMRLLELVKPTPEAAAPDSGDFI